MPHPFADLGNPIIDALGEVNAITLTRYGVGAYSDTTGQWVPGASTDSTLDAVVQPSTPKEIQALPENERTREAITVWTREELKTSDVVGSEQADQIAWKGRQYKAQVKTDWTSQAGYCQTVATRLGE